MAQGGDIVKGVTAFRRAPRMRCARTLLTSASASDPEPKPLIPQPYALSPVVEVQIFVQGAFLRAMCAAPYALSLMYEVQVFAQGFLRVWRPMS